MTSVWFEGIGDLNTVAVQLEKAGIHGTNQAARVVAKSAHAIESLQKQFAPVDTGATRNSIGVDIGLAGLSADIGPTTSYSIFLEYGTERMPPHSFVGPALDREAPNFVAAMEQIGDPFGGG